MSGDLISTAEVARILGVNRATVINWANRGLLPAYRYAAEGERPLYRFKHAGIEEFIARSRIQSRGAAADIEVADD